VAEDNQESAEAQGAADGEEAVKKKPAGGDGSGGLNPKLVYIVLGFNALFLLALATVVWMQYSKSSQNVTLADIEASKDALEGKEQAAAEAKEGGEGAAAAPAVSNFIKESFTVNLAESGGSHFAKVDVEIEVDDDAVRQEVDRMKPRIRDFIVTVLSSKTYDQIESVDGRDFLREEIRNKINGYLSRGQIKNVYFTQFIIQ
jgi:flagellar FliL protein